MEIKSQRLDITQMPRDADGSLGLVRSALVKAFNYSRRYPTKMTALKLVCKYVYTRINEFEKYEAAMKQHLEEVDTAGAEKAKAGAKASEKAATEKSLADTQALGDDPKTTGA